MCVRVCVCVRVCENPPLGVGIWARLRSESGDLSPRPLFVSGKGVGYQSSAVLSYFSFRHRQDRSLNSKERCGGRKEDDARRHPYGGRI